MDEHHDPKSRSVKRTKSKKELYETLQLETKGLLENERDLIGN
jgi:hypothetical protein